MTTPQAGHRHGAGRLLAAGLTPALLLGVAITTVTAAQPASAIQAGAAPTSAPVTVAAPVSPVTAAGSQAQVDLTADIPKIEVILPPPPPPQPTKKARSGGGSAAGGGKQSGPHVDFCNAGGGASVRASSLDGLLAAANAERAIFGYAPLSWSGSLASAAQGWSNQMVANDVATSTHHDAMAHNPNRPGGENVAMSYNMAGALTQGAAIELAHHGWMRSPGHCRNILNPKWSTMGAGIALTPDGTTWYSTVNFK